LSLVYNPHTARNYNDFFLDYKFCSGVLEWEMVPRYQIWIETHPLL
jgi:hypothetical protein